VDAAGIELKKAYDLFNSGKKQAGMLAATKVASQYPREPKVQLIAGQLLLAGKNISDAAILYERALALDPTNPQIFSALGGAYFELKNHDKAIELLSRAIEINPSDSIAHSQISQAFWAIGELEKAFDHAGKAFAMDPLDEHVVENYAHGLLLMNQAEGVRFLRNAVRDRPSSLRLPNQLACAQLYCEGLDESEVIDGLRVAGERYASWVPQLDLAGHDFSCDRKIRVGILSSELRRHSVAGFLAPILKHVDRSKFEIFLYSTYPTSDDFSKQLIKGHQWREAAGLSPDQVCALVRKDKIDLLIETWGWFEGCQPMVMAMKPAPITMHMIGFPHTSGSSRVDLRLGDDFVDSDLAEERYSERVARIEGPFLCYEALHRIPELGEQRSADAPVVFGSFNNCLKLQPSMLETWKKVLDAVQNSRLLVKTNQVNAPAYRASMMRLIEATGLIDQTIIMPTTETLEEHLACYSQVDIALDTYPYSGTTTTIEALMMGVPVVTVMGDSHRSRVSAMMLEMISKPEWIARDYSQYEEILLSLVGRIGDVRAGKQLLRTKLLESKLFDGPDYARRVENLWERLWLEKCSLARDEEVYLA
jgi:predicted O-linked N-acetylglucosamine transferase (SPINDLY family)